MGGSSKNNQLLFAALLLGVALLLLVGAVSPAVRSGAWVASIAPASQTATLSCDWFSIGCGSDAPAPYCEIYVSPSSVAVGQNTTVFWNCNNLGDAYQNLYIKDSFGNNYGRCAGLDGATASNASGHFVITMYQTTTFYLRINAPRNDPSFTPSCSNPISPSYDDALTTDLGWGGNSSATVSVVSDPCPTYIETNPAGQSSGLILYAGATRKVTQLGNNFCLTNNSSNHYFIPAKTSAELQSFLNAISRLNVSRY